MYFKRKLLEKGGRRKLLSCLRREVPKTLNLFTTTEVLTSSTSQMDYSASTRHCYEPVLKWNPEVERYFCHAYGAERFACISKALTCPSKYSCIRVNTLQTTVDDVVEKLQMILDEKAMETVSISKCQIPGLEYVLLVHGSGPNTINYCCPPEASQKEIIVSRKCGEAVLRGAQVFVPGVMACSSHVEKGDRVAVSVALEKQGPSGEWAIPMTRGTVLQGSQDDPYYIERHGLYIGLGMATMSRAGIFRAAEGIAVDIDTRVFSLPSLHGVMNGEIFLQNLPSIIAAHVLDPQRNEKILDMCAAPGGKTTAIAILMKDQGQVFAIDRSHNKVLNIQKLAAEMGLSCIMTYKMDALKSVSRETEPVDTGDIQHPDGLPLSKDKELNFDQWCVHSIGETEQSEGKRYLSKAPIRKIFRKMKNGPGRNQSLGSRAQQVNGFRQDSFDRVLLDAPCSALGLRPRLFVEEETMDTLRNHALYQRRMFDQAVKLVRSGGVIVYSTCTLNPGENEALVRYALDRYKFLSLASQHPKVAGPGLVGCYESKSGYIEEWLRPGEEHMVQRFDPSSSLETIGFFIAKFNVGAKVLDSEQHDSG